MTSSVSVQAHVTVKELKKNIKNQLPTLKHQTLIRLVHNRKELHDHEPLTLHALPHLARIAPLPDPTPFLSFLPKSLLDPAWDRHWDESHPLELTGTDCTRGGRSYARPVGWMRFGLKVKGKYEDDDWLGTPGPRNHSHPNEWFVTFHGTAFRNAASIAKNGYNTPQVWSTTDINVTLGYSQKGFFQVNGKQYRVVMQNRVRPGATAHFGYHYDCNQTQFPVLPRDIRPYAILICPMAPSQQYPY
ncbi:uncharacterized protein EV422DRAFT_61543 [Fimicolochytrium jonesii]|uniref:uncharacterized protein n=1 Tax=Fimicolochytrium jonesii TaxID=1396493 RepID=UPI0022FDEE6C|nr:uncharacterized protein EV422DRAFT_61543 [Fimicolochytrium jonesii]KAI8820738.1 hypothetical protein EV422DRAFT_61543 [Fimicolochytrium jonesii]